jgi:AcrR family transcriptional regulator
MLEENETRRAEILMVAARLFIEKGFDAVTTLEIARCVHVSKRDLYRLFGSKQGMLDALIHSHAAVMTRPLTLARAPLNRQAFLDILREFGRSFLAELLDPRRIALHRLAIASAPRSTKVGAALQEAGVEQVMDAAQTFMRHAVAQGIVSREDAELIVTIFFDALIGPWQMRLLLGTHTPPDGVEIAARADRAVEIVRRLIGA